MRKNLLVTLMIVFLFATTFSAGLSYSLSHYLNMQSVVNQLQADELKMAKSFISICNKLNANVNTLSEQFSSSMYIVHVLDEEHIEDISASHVEMLNNGEIVMMSEFMGIDAECMFKINDDIIHIYLNPQSNVIKSFGSRIGIVLLLMLLLSTVLMFFMGKSVTKPIRELNAATKKVAKGDFDVQVDVEDDTEVAQLARSFNSMVTELKSNELLKKDFISNVSHEFKTPLATVNGFAKLLKEGNCTAEEVTEYADIIDHETSRLSTLCSNILKLSRIENQKIAPKPSKFRIDEQMRDVLLVLEPQWTQKDLELDVDLDEVEYCSDEELLQQVWINLLNNAIKFTDTGGRIAVSLKDADDCITVTVADNGIGMSEEAQKHIFEKFYQGDTTHSTEGNGLGLALVKEILDLCTGKIKVKSKLGEGSEFIVKLPKTEQN